MRAGTCVVASVINRGEVEQRRDCHLTLSSSCRKRFESQKRPEGKEMKERQPGPWAAESRMLSENMRRSPEETQPWLESNMGSTPGEMQCGTRLPRQQEFLSCGIRDLPSPSTVASRNSSASMAATLLCSVSKGRPSFLPYL